METVIGLGSAGCNIADEFSKYPQYKIYKLDVGVSGKNCYYLPKYHTPEEYEAHIGDLTKVFSGIEGDILFVVGGSGNVSGGALRMLEQLSHCTINVLYIQPKISLLGEKRQQQERLVYYVLQEYARSGLFEKLYLISNSHLEEVIGGVPVMGYYDKLNEMIVSTMHMINVYNHIDSVTDTFSEPYETARISTIGLFDFDTEENKSFFPLDNVREIRYYYAINKDKLKSEGDLFKRIKKQIKDNATDQTKVSYGIFATNYERDFAYTLSYSASIQKGEIDD